MSGSGGVSRLHTFFKIYPDRVENERLCRKRLWRGGENPMFQAIESESPTFRCQYSESCQSAPQMD